MGYAALLAGQIGSPDKLINVEYMYFGPDMTDDTKHYVATCPHQHVLTKRYVPLIPPIPPEKTLIFDTSLEHIAINITGLLPQTKREYTHISTVIV